ncbi:MAG: GH3 auxin-responsive promoter family protein, partial [Saccharofermentanaceae bacterium]
MPILGSLIRKAYELRQFPIDISVLNPVVEQAKVLKKLLLRAQNTALGEHYGFGNIVSSPDFVDLFRKTVPVHDYGSMFNNWWYRSLNGEAYVAWPGKVKYFALTSGTSNDSSKHIPVTMDM